jgi:hypothetical protein
MTAAIMMTIISAESNFADAKNEDIITKIFCYFPVNDDGLDDWLSSCRWLPHYFIVTTRAMFGVSGSNPLRMEQAEK